MPQDTTLSYEDALKLANAASLGLTNAQVIKDQSDAVDSLINGTITAEDLILTAEGTTDNFATIYMQSDDGTDKALIGLWTTSDGNGGPYMEFQDVAGVGSVLLDCQDGDIRLGGAADQIGFYGAAPVAQQTGVAVSAAAIHAALVNLGLITA